MSMPSKIYSEDRRGKFQPPITYAVKHKDMEVRMSSQSERVFTALSDKILNEKGVVYGCDLTEDLIAVHVRAECEIDRNRIHESEYIQSDMRDIFKLVKYNLEEGRQVLFSGTSCQIAGLRVSCQTCVPYNKRKRPFIGDFID